MKDEECQAHLMVLGILLVTGWRMSHWQVTIPYQRAWVPCWTTRLWRRLIRATGNLSASEITCRHLGCDS